MLTLVGCTVFLEIDSAKVRWIQALTHDVWLVLRREFCDQFTTLTFLAFSTSSFVTVLGTALEFSESLIFEFSESLTISWTTLEFGESLGCGNLFYSRR